MVNQDLLKYFEDNLKKDFSIDQIKNICLQNNFNRNEIDEVIIYLNKKNKNKSLIKIFLLIFFFFFVIVPIFIGLSGYIIYKFNTINVGLEGFSKIYSGNSGINENIIHFYVRYEDAINNNLIVTNGNIILNGKDINCEYNLSGKKLQYGNFYRIELNCNRKIKIGEKIKGDIILNLNGIENIGSFSYPVTKNNISASDIELLNVAINKKMERNLEEIKENSYFSNKSLNEYEEYFENKINK